MKRLTTDTPQGNFETIMNFVFGKDGWAHIRSDGSQENVLLTSWAAAQCARQGCDDVSLEEVSHEGTDEVICDCMMGAPDCPIALAYCFASQAVHLRDRLKMYEDVLFGEDGAELISMDQLRALIVPSSSAPLTLDELREMDGEPVWIIPMRGSGGFCTWMLVDVGYELCREAHGEMAVFENYGKNWLAYRSKPEEVTA